MPKNIVVDDDFVASVKDNAGLSQRTKIAKAR